MEAEDVGEDRLEVLGLTEDLGDQIAQLGGWVVAERIWEDWECRFEIMAPYPCVGICCLGQRFGDGV